MLVRDAVHGLGLDEQRRLGSLRRPVPARVVQRVVDPGERAAFRILADRPELPVRGAEARPAVNFALMVGQGTVRSEVLGTQNRIATPEEIGRIRDADPDLEILVHPECRPDVATLADAVLSTSGMVRYAKERPALRFLVVTECGLSDRLAMEVPDKTFVKGCKLCTFMKVTRLEDVRDSLRDMKYEIVVPEEIRVPAERALRRMFDATE